MIEDILSLGNKIEMREILHTMNEEKQKNVPVYTSQILEFDEEYEGVLNIAMPILEGKLIPLEVGRKFELFFYAKKGMYSCNAEIIRRYRSSNVYVLVVNLLTDLKKYQRRQYFRLGTNIEIQYKTFTQEDEAYFRRMGEISDEMAQRPFSTGVSVDISGGGVKFISGDNMPRETKLLLEISLPFDNELKKFEAVSKVVFTGAVKGRKDSYENRVEFVQIKEEDRELLIKYIFKEERNQRKKMV